MASTEPINRTKKWLHLTFGVLLLISFFLPWVLWDGSKVSGYAMATGDFFKISETKLYISNPFPKLSFLFIIFWLIPLLAAIYIFLTTTGRKSGWLPFAIGGLSLLLITIYFSFTNFAFSKNVLALIAFAGWLHTLAAIGIILSSSNGSLLKKLVWIIIIPAFSFGSFKIIEKYILSETYKDTNKVKADYTFKASEFIREFDLNDSAANNRYSDKIIIVEGPVSQVEMKMDSVVNLKFVDTSKHFINFSLEKTEFEKTKNIKPGDIVSIKGSCSGSSYSLILDSTSITFKRSTLNKTK